MCKFFHGKTGCLREDCVFVHSIQDRVNELLDENTHGRFSNIVDRLLTQSDRFSENTGGTSEVIGLTRAVLDEVSGEIAWEVANETAAEAITEAVNRHRAAMAATVSVVDAIAIVEDAGCPYLRGSLVCELERSFASATLASTTDIGKSHAGDEHLANARNAQQSLAFAAFQARMASEMDVTPGALSRLKQ